MDKITLKICMGTACFITGSSGLLNIKEKLPEKMKGLVEVKPSLCCDMCRNTETTKPPIISVGNKIISMANEEKILAVLEDIFEEGNYC